MVALVLGYLCSVFSFRKIEIMIYNVYICTLCHCCDILIIRLFERKMKTYLFA